LETGRPKLEKTSFVFKRNIKLRVNTINVIL